MPPLPVLPRRPPLLGPSLVVWAALLPVGCGSPAALSRPNVLVVTMDTTRADAIGAYGSPRASTPHVDRIAMEGARFDRAYTVTPLTIPAHSSLHTGLLPPRHGVRDNGDFLLGDEAVTLAERLRDAGYATMASVGAEVTSHHWGFAQGFDAFFDDMGPADPAGNRWRVERAGDKVIGDALGWWDARAAKAGDKSGVDADKPWFAWVHLFDAHHPYEPPEPFASESRGRPYAGEVAYVDAQIGRLLDRLERDGTLDRTWIFVLADHGEGLGSHGEGMHGTLLYDATTRIPFVVRPPGGVVGGRVIPTPVSLVDITPTILSVTGIGVPPGLDGVDLGAVIRGEVPGDATRAVLAESLYAFHHYGWAPQTALVTDTHKLIDSTTPEIYAREDSEEKRDLSELEAPLLETLTARLMALLGTLTPSGGAARADASADRLAQLEALGYLTTAAGEAPTEGLPDPVRQLPVLGKLEKARQALRSGDLPAARLALAAALEADPNLVETRILQANLLWREGDLEGAYAAAEAVEISRPATQTKVMLGTIRTQQGRVTEATRWLSEALSVDPYLAAAWPPYLHALVLSNDPRLPAEAARAHQLMPDLPPAIGMHGFVLASQGKHAAAELLLNDALAREPNQPFLNHALGLVYRSQGEAMKAESALDEEVRLFPPGLTSRRTLVQMYAEQKRYADQLVQLTEIRAKEQANPETLHSIAQALFNLKRYAEARPVVDACRAIDPAYPGCALLEANVLKKLGKDAEAQVAYERAVALQRVAAP